MTQYLMFHLYAPLQSWGGVAVGEVRASDRCPSRSGVLGLVAAALGIDREDDKAHQKLSHHLGFGLRICAAGNHLSDYHTAQVPSRRKGGDWSVRSWELDEPKLNTILTTRHYLSDALFAIALWQLEPFDLDQLVRAFRSPVFPLYLGRKSCPPGLPIKPKLSEAPDLDAAFQNFKLPASILEIFGADQINGRELLFDSCSLSQRASSRQIRYDQPGSRSRWTFLPRTQYTSLLSKEES